MSERAALEPLFIRMHEADNVAIVVNDGGLRAIAAGAWVHERLLQMPAARTLTGLPMATVRPPPMSALEGYTFEGYRNADGLVGSRNILAITTTVQCAAGVAIDAPDVIIPIRTLRNISLNPNFGGEVMVVSLGCEKLQPERLLPPGVIPITDQRGVADVGINADAGLDVVCLQSENHVGFMSMIDAIMEMALLHLERLDARRRETVPASELVAGVQCGGSDAFSGVTANPAVGFATDLLVRAGASVMFSEVAEAMIREMAWYDNYLQKGQVDRSANTTPRATKRAACPTSSRRRWAPSSSPAPLRFSACCRRARSSGKKA